MRFQLKIILLLLITFGLCISVRSILAWTVPTATPPNWNMAAPINTGSAAQVKDGSLGVNGNFSAGSLIANTLGKVGVGITPNYKLDVNGQINASNGLCMNGVCRTSWNDVSSNSGAGGVFMRWGRGDCPNGTDNIYSGMGFNNHYSHYGGATDPVCMIPNNPGAAAPGAPYYGDLLYPMHTGDPTRMPPGITNYRYIKCASCYSTSAVVEVYGNDNCPNGWEKAYKGYAMGNYYYEGHYKGARICMEAETFDSSSVYSSAAGEYLVGTVMWSAPDGKTTEYPYNKFVKCAVCKKTPNYVPPLPQNFNITISSNRANFNLYQELANVYSWSTYNVVYVTVTINPGVYVYSTSVSLPAFDTGSGYPLGSTISIINKGNIYGMGGTGGSCVDWYAGGPAGSSGGPAFTAQTSVSMTNNGIIAGGGGGGGTGGGGLGPDYGWSACGGGGGGGGGYNGGSGGTSRAYSTQYAGGSGAAGSTTAGGGGGAWFYSGGYYSGYGGNGGAPGYAGSSGSSGNYTGGGGGGAAGNYVIGNSFITWITAGTLRGAVN